MLFAEILKDSGLVTAEEAKGLERERQREDAAAEKARHEAAMVDIPTNALHISTEDCKKFVSETIRLFNSGEHRKLEAQLLALRTIETRPMTSRALTATLKAYCYKNAFLMQNDGEYFGWFIKMGADSIMEGLRKEACEYWRPIKGT